VETITVFNFHEPQVYIFLVAAMAIRARTVGTPQSQAAALAELGAVVNSEGGLGRGVNRGSPGVMAGCIEYGDLLSVMEGRLEEAMEFGRKVGESVDGWGGT
jgi:hypothetical protein